MKKVNLYFIGECIIIILLLTILGVLLKSNGADAGMLSAEEIAVEDNLQEEVRVEESADSGENATTEEATYSGIQNVADYVGGQEGIVVSGNSIEETQKTRAPLVSLDSEVCVHTGMW